MNIENMIQGNPQALVKSVNGIMVADSLQVADSFGKQHSHVLRAIESLITSLSTEEAAVNDEEWMYKKIAGNSQSNFGLAGNYFIPDTYADKQGKERKHYWLTRDGFSLLVMGFTGPAALHWKLLYIEAFNKMEQALRSNVDIKDLRTLLYDVPDDSEVMVLNENAPIKGAVPVEQTFTIKGDKGNNLVIMYQSKNGKEGTK